MDYDFPYIGNIVTPTEGLKPKPPTSNILEMIIIHFEVSRSNLGRFGLGQIIWSSANNQRIRQPAAISIVAATRVDGFLPVWISAFSETVKLSWTMQNPNHSSNRSEYCSWCLLVRPPTSASSWVSMLLKPPGRSPWVPSLKNQGSLYSHSTLW